jgi:hypothetical protein
MLMFLLDLCFVAECEMVQQLQLVCGPGTETKVCRECLP